jgi:hypothetical protein
MALQALWAPETQFQNKNGSLLVQGQIYVQYRGRSQLAKTYRDAEGTYLNTNPLLTDNDGRVLCFADDRFSYTAIVCDFYGNELFSFDPIPCGSGSGSGSSSGSSAQHWIGINGQTQKVSRNTYTRLKLPSGLDNVDYDGDFVMGTIKGSGTEMVLKEGLYLVNTVIRFKQSSDDLTNTLSNVIIHTRDFDTPNIQEVGAVVRDEAGPDASDDIHTITLTYIRHVSKDDVGSERIKFAVETPNTWTECYIQNLQIAKLGSSVGGGGSAEMYSAGDYISIENDTISVTGIDPDSYATHDELQSATSAFITSADLPDLSDYATEQWVLDKHYITSADIPDIPDDLVTSAELAQTSGAIEQDITDLTSAISEALSDKMDKSSSGDFYPRYDNPEGYLTSVPSEYVTESEMSGYVQDHTSGFITSADLPDVSDMATKTWVNEQHYITSADVPPQVEYSAGDNIDITNHVVSVTDTSLLLPGDNVSITPSGNDYIISAQIPGTSGYVTEQEMNDAIESATSAFITSADLPDVSDMATQTWVTEQNYITSADIPPIPEDVVTSGELATVSGEIVNQIPDTSDMATKTWVGEQGYLTSVPSEYVTDTELESELSGKADTSAIPDVSNFVTQEDIDAAVSGKMDATESSAFYPMATNPSGYLVSSDLNGYATESYVTSQTSGKQDTLTFGYDSSDKINAINGSAIAGGGSVPEGVMVESGLQYNAVGEISGYGESAIAQYGAEKQWLVHDDTIVHMSNSAQYAFGVNLSAVAQLLGVDETVLFTGMLSGTSSYETLSEPVSAFNYIQVEGYTHNGPEFPWISKTPVNESGTTYSIGINQWRDGGEMDMSRFYLSGDRITLQPGYAMAGNNWVGSKNVYVTKIVGIGRKLSN